MNTRDTGVYLAVAMSALRDIKDNGRCECGDAEFKDGWGKTQLCAGIHEDGTPHFCPYCTAKGALREISEAQRETQKCGAV